MKKTKIEKFLIKRPRPDDFPTPYAAGRDSAINGANTANSHFMWFSSWESTREWERGRASVCKPVIQRGR
jgi:hypothetical protein